MNTAAARWYGAGADVAGALAIVLCVDGLLFVFAGDTGSRGGRLLAAIPGRWIGAMWILLFALLGIAHGRTRRLNLHRGGAARRSVAVLVTACGLYPAYTLGLRGAVIGLFGNLATLGLAAYAVARTWPVDRASAGAPVAVMAWVAFATLSIVDDERWLW